MFIKEHCTEKRDKCTTGLSSLRLAVGAMCLDREVHLCGQATAPAD